MSAYKKYLLQLAEDYELKAARARADLRAASDPRKELEDLRSEVRGYIRSVRRKYDINGRFKVPQLNELDRMTK